MVQEESAGVELHRSASVLFWNGVDSPFRRGTTSGQCSASSRSADAKSRLETGREQDRQTPTTLVASSCGTCRRNRRGTPVLRRRLRTRAIHLAKRHGLRPERTKRHLRRHPVPARHIPFSSIVPPARRASTRVFSMILAGRCRSRARVVTPTLNRTSEHGRAMS